mmetsp:Transcript_4529/g.6656  ORF Transcript_4529/g.6656 Transcript_4529/m.6656 type:complete len:111 (-) Transcript_4529:240-572(-)
MNVLPMNGNDMYCTSWHDTPARECVPLEKESALDTATVCTSLLPRSDTFRTKNRTHSAADPTEEVGRRDHRLVDTGRRPALVSCLLWSSGTDTAPSGSAARARILALLEK